MNTAFAKYTEQLPEYMTQLLQMPLQQLQHHNHVLPNAGIYVLYENDAAQYVGRTERMKKRLKEHGAPYSNHNSASFAFLVAKEQAHASGVDCSRKRGVLQGCPLFVPHFMAAKAKVAAMAFRFVKIGDPIEQTLFEVYAAVELKTRHNSFKPH